MKSNLFALMGGAAFGFAFCSLISALVDHDTSFVLSVDGDKLANALERRFRSATLRELYEDNKISIERQGGFFPDE